jgi:2-keto-3-deoxy-L-rhamnonate aldolase RhmA
MAEVRQVVSDCRYPPQGTRGFGPRVPTNYEREDNAAYVARINRELFVAVQIETAEALAAVDEIVRVPGLDSIVIGPWDLSGGLGMLGEVEHPTVVAAIEQIIARCRAAGLSVGAGMGVDAGYAAKMAQRGVQWLQVGSDFGYMIQALDRVAAEIRVRL